MDKIKKITIITLTYKNSHLLDTAISSVNSQVINSKYVVEYLVVDDGSPNFSRENIEAQLEESPFQCRLIINPKNLGTVKSFNRAILESSGDVIIPLSADDEFYDSYVIRDIIHAFDRGEDLIITGLRVAACDNEELSCLPSKGDRILFSDREALLHKISNGNIISGASTYYRRIVFDRIGLFDQNYKLMEDLPFFLKALSSGVDITLLSRKVIKYGVNGISSAAVTNLLFKADSVRAYKYAIKLNRLSLTERRHVYYNRVLDRKGRLTLINFLLHPDFLIISVFNRLNRKNLN
jgi:GT2 family glycosyltransferase